MDHILKQSDDMKRENLIQIFSLFRVPPIMFLPKCTLLYLCLSLSNEAVEIDAPHPCSLDSSDLTSTGLDSPIYGWKLPLRLPHHCKLSSNNLTDIKHLKIEQLTNVKHPFIFYVAVAQLSRVWLTYRVIRLNSLGMNPNELSVIGLYSVYVVGYLWKDGPAW